MEVTLSDAEISSGEAVEIRLVVANPTDGPVSFMTNSCVLVARVLDSEGDTVFQAPDLCNDIGLIHTLGAGEVLADTIAFDGTAQPSGAALPPGTYHVYRGLSSHLRHPSEPVGLRAPDPRLPLKPPYALARRE